MGGSLPLPLPCLLWAFDLPYDHGIIIAISHCASLMVRLEKRKEKKKGLVKTVSQSSLEGTSQPGDALQEKGFYRLRKRHS